MVGTGLVKSRQDRGAGLVEGWTARKSRQRNRMHVGDGGGGDQGEVGASLPRLFGFGGNGMGGKRGESEKEHEQARYDEDDEEGGEEAKAKRRREEKNRGVRGRKEGRLDG